MLAERACHLLCLSLGRMLRAARYATTRVVPRDAGRVVRKRRSLHGPLLVLLGAPLARFLDTGVRVLPQHEWEEHERTMHHRLRGARIDVEPDGTLVLPFLPGESLATLLENPASSEEVRQRAIALAVRALRELHRAGLTHADAMAENVMVDLEAGVAHWFDFETVHEAHRPLAWRRADDLRALVATCLLRTAPTRVDRTLQLMLDAYADEAIAGLVAAGFASSCRRRLVLHLGQAPLSFARFRQIGRVLRSRSGP